MTDRALFLGGEWTSGSTTVEVVNPATGASSAPPRWPTVRP